MPVIHTYKLTALIITILDLVLPRQCIACRAPRTLLCAKCLAKVPSAPPVEHSFIRAIFDYHHPSIKRAVWRFKYKNVRGFAEVFAEKLYEEIVGDLGDSLHVSQGETFLLVPVPLHKKRLRERGYNQSELLARALIAYDRAHMFELVPDLLVRTRATTPQARSEKRVARVANLRGAFICTDSARVRGRVVVVIDDVTTTGATLLEAKRALALAKPRKVLAFAVAH
jgi:ComF family protein